MSIETSNFAVTRRGQTYRVLGSDLVDVLEEGDALVLQRGDNVYKYVVASPTTDVSDILGSDLFACTDTDDVTYSVTGQQFKELFDTAPPVFDRDGYNECVTIALKEKNYCYLLCESAYCRSICDSEYEKSITICKEDFHYPI